MFRKCLIIKLKNHNNIENTFIVLDLFKVAQISNIFKPGSSFSQMLSPLIHSITAHCHSAKAV